MTDQLLNVGIVDLHQLREPMDDLDIWVAAHLAEDCCAFNGLVSNFVEFAE